MSKEFPEDSHENPAEILPAILRDPNTDHYAVFGNPIKHSLSPQIHKQFAEQTEQQLSYQAIQVPLDKFQETVEQFRAAGGHGLNVTVPFKQQAWELAQQRSEFAERAGAVNTLWFDQHGQILADNTDGRGLIRDIMINHQQVIKAKRVLILGAGGAVRGVLQPLLEEKPLNCVIANRTLSRAIELSELFSDLGSITALEFTELDNVNAKFDIVINGTSASLQGELPPIPDNILAENCFCYDMMYSKTQTPFVKWALDQGAVQATDGLGMLVEQAAEAFFIWRGVRPQTKPVIFAYTQTP